MSLGRVLPLVLTALGIWWISGCASSRSEATGAISLPQSYLRNTQTADGTLKLEVAARAFRPQGKRGPVVWLVGVTHLGEKEYYRQLQQFLAPMSLVLFEGVGATNGEFQLEEEDTYSLQADLAKSLGLQFQLDAIDYGVTNFQNCDLTFEQLLELLPPAVEGTSAPGGPGLEELLQLMQGEGVLGAFARFGVSVIAASPRLQATVKVVMIETFDALPTHLAEWSGLPAGFKDLMRLLIDERNRAVLAGLDTALRTRPRPRSIAVFYGAAHMTDLESRVREHWHCGPSDEWWFTAFTVNPARAGVSDFELGLIRELLRQQLGATNQR